MLNSKNRKILIVADALANCMPASDTSLAIAQGAISNGFLVYWCESRHINIYNRDVEIEKLIQVKSVSVQKVDFEKINDEILPNGKSLNQFEYVFIRKDPPFDEAYKDLCWILGTQTNIKIINSPSSLLTHHEKSLPYFLYNSEIIQEGNLTATCVSSDIKVIKRFCSNLPEKIVSKPWLGHAGRGVELHNSYSDLVTFLDNQEKLDTQFLAKPIIFQEFIKDIATVGDRRVIVVNGEYFCDFVRIPATGKIESNLAQGGTAELRPMNSELRLLVDNIAAFLKKQGIVLAGLDLIGNKVSEINITSPTGIRAAEKLLNKELCLNFFENLTRNQDAL